MRMEFSHVWSPTPLLRATRNSKEATGQPRNVRAMVAIHRLPEKHTVVWRDKAISDRETTRHPVLVHLRSNGWTVIEVVSGSLTRRDWDIDADSVFSGVQAHPQWDGDWSLIGYMAVMCRMRETESILASRVRDHVVQSAVDAMRKRWARRVLARVVDQNLRLIKERLWRPTGRLVDCMIRERNLH